MNSDFQTTGRVWFRKALNEPALQSIETQIANGEASTRAAHLAETLASLQPLREILDQFGQGSKPTRVVSFNKSATKNWTIPWHQDRVITAPEKREQDGYKNWTNKNGQWHCEPPQSVLDAMVFVRIHLDKTTRDQGPMEIALGSHTFGIVPTQQCKQMAETCKTELCTANRGDVLVLKMLTLHRSIASNLPEDRRAIRADYAFEA